MNGYRRIAYGLLFTAALWVLPHPAIAAEEAASAGDTGLLAAHLAALREASGEAEEKVLTPKEKAQRKREETHKKHAIQKYKIVYEDEAYVYYLDMENLRWRSIPYTEERMLDVWVRLVPVVDAAAAEMREAGGDLYTGHYYLEHYYMRRSQRQIQFLAELEVNGRPKNDVATGKYSSAAWEDLVPGSLEDSLYNRIMRKVSNPKDKALSTSVSSILEDVFHIYL